VTFGPGPIGLELEPSKDTNFAACKVQRFADAGPQQPGPARRSGEIQPGDFLVQVNGSRTQSYEETIQLLKNSNSRREITFQRAWGRTAVVPATPQVGRTHRLAASNSRVPGTLHKTPKDVPYSPASSATESDASQSIDLALVQNPEDGILLSNLARSGNKSGSTVPAKDSVDATASTRLLDRLEKVHQNGNPGPHSQSTSPSQPNTDLLEQLNCTRKELVSTQSSLASTTSELETFRLSKESVERAHQDELEANKQQLEHYQASIAQLEKELVSLRKNNDSQQGQNEIAAREFEKQVQDLEQRLESLQQERDSLEYKAWQLEERLRQAEQERDSLSSELESQRDAVHATNMALVQDFETAQANNESLSIALSEAKEDLEHTRTELSSKSALLERLQLEKDETDGQFRVAETQKAEHMATVDELRSKLHFLEEERQTHLAEVQRRSSILRENEVRVDELNEKLTESKAAEQILKIEVQRLRSGLEDEVHDSSKGTQLNSQQIDDESDQGKELDREDIRLLQLQSEVDDTRLRLEEAKRELYESQEVVASAVLHSKLMEEKKESFERLIQTSNRHEREVQSVNDELSRELETTKGERDTLAESARDTRLELATAKSQLTEAECRIQELETENNKLRKDLNVDRIDLTVPEVAMSMNGEKVLLSTRIEELESELYITMESAKQYQENSHQLEASNTALAKELESVKIQSRSYNEIAAASRKDLLEMLRKKDEQLAAKNRDLEDAQLGLEAMRTDLKRKAMELEGVVLEKTNTSEDIIAILSEKRQLVGEVSKLTTERDDALEDRAGMAVQLREARDIAKSFAASDDKSRHQRAEVQEISAQLDEKQRSLDSALSTASSLKSDVRSLEERVDDLSLALKDSSGEESWLRSQLESARKELQDLRSTAKSLADLDSTKAEDASTKIQDLELAMKKKNAELTTLSSRLEAAQSKLARMASELSWSKSDHQLSARKITELEEERSKLIEKLGRLREETEENAAVMIRDSSEFADAMLCESRNEIAELRRQVRSLEKSKAVSSGEIKTMQEKHKELSILIGRLRSDVYERDATLSTKALDHINSIAQIDKLQEELNVKTDELKAVQNELCESKRQKSQLSKRFTEIARDSSKEKDSLASELIESQTELSAIKTKHSELERLNRSLRRSLTESESRFGQTLEKLVAERESFQELKTRSNTERDQLDHRNSLLSTEVVKYRNMIGEIKQERDRSRLEVVDLKAVVECLKKEHRFSEALLRKQDEKLSGEKEEAVAALKKETERADLAYTLLQKAEFDFDRVRQQGEVEFRQKIENASVERQELEIKLTHLAIQLENKDAELRDLYPLKEELETTKMELNHLRESLARSHDEVEHLSSLLDSTRDETGRKLIELSEAHLLEVQRLSEEKDVSETALRKSDEKSELLKKRLCKVEESVHAARAEREHLLAENDVLKSRMHEADGTLADLRAEIDDKHANVSVSSDSSASEEFKDLSKSDLRRRCRDLQDELFSSQAQLECTESQVKRRSEHIQKLEEDLKLMTTEIENLVSVNGQVEDRLRDLRADRESMVIDASSLRTKANLSEQTSRTLNQQLEEQVTRNASLADEVQVLSASMEQMRHDSADRLREAEAAIASLEIMLEKASHVQNDADIKLSSKDAQLSKTKMEIESLEETISDLEKQLLESIRKFNDARQEAENLRAKSSETSASLGQCLEQLTIENAASRKKTADLESKLGIKCEELLHKDEQIKLIDRSLEELRSKTRASELLREDLVAKLAEASRVVTAQKEEILAFETQAATAERKMTSLSAQIKNFQEAIKKMDNTNENGWDFRVKQIEELEIKCATLETARCEAKSEADSLRNELRQARRQLTGAEKKVGSLQAQISNMKSTANETKIRLRDAISARENLHSDSMDLHGELEIKQMEADHLKARLQVLNATIARMKSDHILLQEAALQAECQAAASKEKSEEFAKLQSELQRQNAKLESLTAVYQDRGDALSHPEPVNDQLVQLTEDILMHAEYSFSKISARSTDLESFGNRAFKRESVEALDLAQSVEDSNNFLIKFRVCLDELSCIIPEGLSNLEVKRGQFNEWKLRRGRQAEPSPIKTTPNAKRKSTSPKSSPVLDALNKMKVVLEEEVLSPNKNHCQKASRLDVEYMHKVVQALETQIDSLLDDLRSANDALQAKDQLFADLEQLVIHHESERDLLEQKLEGMNRFVREMEDRLSQEVSWKEAAEMELKCIQEGLAFSSAAQVDKASESACQLAAARLLYSVTERRETVTKAAVLRHWSCQTSAMRAVAQQSHAATELAHQLDATREKLIILKRRMKRKGRPSALDSITEGYETT
jgi:chromosome segregation ATPase